MAAFSGILLASFTTPMHIDTDPLSMLWLLPLVASIAVVYKATKVYKIAAVPFLRESAVLFWSILVFVVVVALFLYGLGWVVTDLFPNVLSGSAF
jgi:hypothetical protein